MVCLWVFNPSGIHFCVWGRDLTPFAKWNISTQLLNSVSFPLHLENATSYTICPHSHAFVSGLKIINSNIELSPNQYCLCRCAVSPISKQTNFLARNSPLPALIILSPLVPLACVAGFLSFVGVVLCVTPETFDLVNRLNFPNKWWRAWYFSPAYSPTLNLATSTDFASGFFFQPCSCLLPGEITICWNLRSGEES